VSAQHIGGRLHVGAPHRALVAASLHTPPFKHIHTRAPRYCLGAGLALAEMKVLLALLARHYAFTADTATEWVQRVGHVPKVCGCGLVMAW
jgi:cytochrome P450